MAECGCDSRGSQSIAVGVRSIGPRVIRAKFDLKALVNAEDLDAPFTALFTDIDGVGDVVLQRADKQP
jgi:hypothetical protein